MKKKYLLIGGPLNGREVYSDEDNFSTYTMEPPQSKNSVGFILIVHTYEAIEDGIMNYAGNEVLNANQRNDF